MSDLLLGLDIGGTKCAALVGTRAGDVVDRKEWASNAGRGPDAMLADLLAAARELIARHGRVACVGCSIGGPLDAGRGVVHSPPNLPGWDGIELTHIVADALGVNTKMEHDAAACAMAEYLWGAGQGAKRLIYLTCGTGFGAGMVFDGQIYRGATGGSVEIGHITYRQDGPTAFGKPGTYEAFCSGPGLGRIATWKFPHRWPTPPDSTEISRLAKAGDPDAAAIIQINATAVGDACALVGDLLVPDTILLGSLARYLGPAWVAQVRAQFNTQVLASVSRSCTIAPAGLGDRLQDLSALAVAAAATS